MLIRNPKLLKDFRTAGPCELCNLYADVREPHHLRAKGMGGNGRLDVRINLIALGGSVRLEEGRRRFSCECHYRLHAGMIDPARVLAIVAAREGVSPAEIIEVMDFFRRTVKPTPSQLTAALLDELTPAAWLLATRELSP